VLVLCIDKIILTPADMSYDCILISRILGLDNEDVVAGIGG